MDDKLKQVAFSSFFMGEGMIRISRDWRRSGHAGKGPKILWYRQIARITLRQDDEKVLDWILNNFGGHIFRRGIRNNVKNKHTGTIHQSNPVTIWQEESVEGCARICQMILDNPMPSKKKDEAKIFMEFVRLKRDNYVRGKSYPPDVYEKFEFYHQEMKALKKYKGS